MQGRYAPIKFYLNYSIFTIHYSFKIIMYKNFVLVNHCVKEEPMNTRIYRNSYEQPKGGWENQNQSSVRSATPMERARSRAAGYSAIAIIVMLCLAITFTSIALSSNPKKPSGEETIAPIAFALPITGEFSISKYYADDKLQWNETAKQWQGFKAINMQATMGQSVVATYAGTVTEVSNSAMYGTVVKIQHRDGLMTVYSGLDPETDVKRGDYVEKGQKIGKVGNTGNSSNLSNKTTYRRL